MDHICPVMGEKLVSRPDILGLVWASAKIRYQNQIISTNTRRILHIYRPILMRTMSTFPYYMMTLPPYRMGFMWTLFLAYSTNKKGVFYLINVTRRRSSNCLDCGVPDVHNLDTFDRSLVSTFRTIYKSASTVDVPDNTVAKKPKLCLSA